MFQNRAAVSLLFACARIRRRGWGTAARQFARAKHLSRAREILGRDSDFVRRNLGPVIAISAMDDNCLRRCRAALVSFGEIVLSLFRADLHRRAGYAPAVLRENVPIPLRFARSD